jgi:protein involved in polysaccharide export with SLBB domain
LIERIDPSDPNAPRRVLEKSFKGLDLATPLVDGDIVRVFDVAPRFSNAVTLRGNVAAPLRYPHFPGMRLSDLIPEPAALMEASYFVRKNRLVQFEDGSTAEFDRASNPPDESRGRRPIEVTGYRGRLSEPHWEYAIIERLSSKDLKPQLIPFSLRKLLIDREPGSNSLLEPGDVVTIFSKTDFSVPKGDYQRLVRVEGEVMSPGVYPVDDRDSPNDVIRLAGGLTSNAFLFGTEFFRESVRIDQQKNLETAKQRIKERSAAAISEQSQNIDPSQAAMLREKLELSRAISARIDSLKASGRLSMRLSIDSTTLPSVSLEDGDRIYIPARPASVNVFGAVNIESALIFQPGRIVADYLALAGLRADAERNDTFVIRADGTVLNGHTKRSLLRLDRGLESEEVYPGDTIVVPEKFDKESAFTAFMRSARDFAVVFGQLGIGAAAIKTLRQ